MITSAWLNRKHFKKGIKVSWYHNSSSFPPKHLGKETEAITLGLNENYALYQAFKQAL